MLNNILCKLSEGSTTTYFSCPENLKLLPAPMIELYLQSKMVQQEGWTIILRYDVYRELVTYAVLAIRDAKHHIITCCITVVVMVTDYAFNDVLYREHETPSTYIQQK